MSSITDFKKGSLVVYNNEPARFIEYQHVKPGKGGAFVRTKMKLMMSGKVLENTFKPGDAIEEASVEKKKCQYLYEDSGSYVFMDQETFDQYKISGLQMDGKEGFLKEETDVIITFWNGDVIDVELPTKMEFEVIESAPAVKGDSSSNIQKEVVIETGAKVRVPAFIKQGDIIRVSTSTGEYSERAN